MVAFFFFLVTEKKLSANIYGRKEIINPPKKNNYYQS